MKQNQINKKMDILLVFIELNIIIVKEKRIKIKNNKNMIIIKMILVI